MCEDTFAAHDFKHWLVVVNSLGNHWGISSAKFETLPFIASTYSEFYQIICMSEKDIAKL
jgi:hypothetical protein